MISAIFGFSCRVKEKCGGDVSSITLSDKAFQAVLMEVATDRRFLHMRGIVTVEDDREVIEIQLNTPAGPITIKKI